MKIYGNVKKQSADYFVVEYTEYRNGKKVSCGSEDFSQARYSSIPRYEIRVWDGQAFNRGGQRLFKHHDLIKTTGKPKDLKQIFAYLGKAVSVIKWP